MSYDDTVDREPYNEVGDLIRGLAQVTVRRLQLVLSAEGLTNTQWQVLVSVSCGRGLTCAALARDLAHDGGATTRLVDGLEKRGLVRRERNAVDRRVIDLALTDFGRDLAQRGKVRTIECWHNWLSGWEVAEVDWLTGQLQRLLQTIEDAPADCA